jgi:hypothetical protein
MGLGTRAERPLDDGADGLDRRSREPPACDRMGTKPLRHLASARRGQEAQLARGRDEGNRVRREGLPEQARHPLGDRAQAGAQRAGIP